MSFLKVLTHAKNTDNHCWSAVMQYFECMVPKTFYSCFLCLRNKKVINFQVFPILVQKCWPQQKLWHLAKNVVVIWCRTVWSIFVHNLVTIEQKVKKWWREGPMDSPPTVFELQRFKEGGQISIFYMTNILSRTFMPNCGQCWCETFLYNYVIRHGYAASFSIKTSFYETNNIF